MAREMPENDGTAAEHSVEMQTASAPFRVKVRVTAAMLDPYGPMYSIDDIRWWARITPHGLSARALRNLGITTEAP